MLCTAVDINNTMGDSKCPFPSFSVLFFQLPAVSQALITVFILTCVMLSKNIVFLEAIMQKQTTALLSK